MPKRKKIDVPETRTAPESKKRDLQSKNDDKGTSHSASSASNAPRTFSEQPVDPSNQVPAYLTSLGMSLEDLLGMASDQPDTDNRPDEDGLGMSDRTISAQELAWKRFEEYFEGRIRRGTIDSIPGKPRAASDLLAKDSPHIDYATFVAFIEWTAARCTTPRITDRMASGTAENIFKNLRSYMARRRNVKLPRTTVRDVKKAINGSIVDKGLLHREPKPKFITDQDGHRSLAVSALNAQFLVKHIRSRFQALFWMAVTAQTSVRRGAMLPPAAHDMDRALTYKHMTLHILGNGEITLKMAPPNTKTAEGEGAEYILVQTPEFYRCPVFLFLLLAHLDDALPLSTEQICRRAALSPDEAPPLDVKAQEEALDKPIFRASKDGINDIALTDHVWSEQLTRLSRISGFSTNITAHAFRRMVAIFMRARGSVYADIQLKLAHRLEGTVTRIYMNLVCPADISSAVWGGQNRTLESLKFHPQVLREDRNAPTALDSVTRAEIFASDEVCTIVEELQAVRGEAQRDFGPEIASYPPEVTNKLEEKWLEYRRVYSGLYREQLVKVLGDYHHDNSFVGGSTASTSSSIQEINALDDIPADGASLNYDAEAIEMFLSSVNMDNAAQIISATQEMRSSEHLESSSDQTDSPSDPHEGEHVLDNDDRDISPTETDKISIDLIKTHLIESGNDMLSVIQACAQLNSNTRAVFKSRPQHDWTDCLCPCCGSSLWAAAEVTPRITENHLFGSNSINLFTTHIAQCHAQKALANIEQRLLTLFPARLPQLPVVLRPREPKKRAHSDEAGTHNLYEMSIWLDSRSRDGLEQACSACEFKNTSVSVLKAHLLVEHKWWMPPTTTAWMSSPNAQSYLRNEWTAFSAKFPPPRWHWHDRSYHADPRELELFCERYFQERILEPAKSVQRFGARKDVILGPYDLTADQNGFDSDRRYEFVQQRAGPVEQEGLCLLNVWNPTLSWTERMCPVDRGHSAFALQNRTVLLTVLAGLDLLFEELKMEEAGVDVAQKKKDDTKEKSRIKSAKRKARQQTRETPDLDTNEEGSSSTKGHRTAQKGPPEADENIPIDPALLDLDREQPKRRRARRSAPRDGLSRKTGALSTPRKFSGRPSDLRYLVQDGQLACPDSVCRSNGHKSATQTSFVNHLVVVHHFALFSDHAVQTSTLDTLGFRDEQELSDFRGVPRSIDREQDEAEH